MAAPACSFGSRSALVQGNADDIAGRFTDGGWWVGTSNGSGFTNTKWTTWSATGWSDVMVGEFNSDDDDDIVGRWRDGGWWVGLSDGSGSFTNTKWTTWSATGWSDVMVGSFAD